MVDIIYKRVAPVHMTQLGELVRAERGRDATSA
jgi:hypothetical protein